MSVDKNIRDEVESEIKPFMDLLKAICILMDKQEELDKKYPELSITDRYKLCENEQRHVEQMKQLYEEKYGQQKE